MKHLIGTTHKLMMLVLLASILCTSCERQEELIEPMSPMGLTGQEGDARVTSHQFTLDEWRYDSVENTLFQTIPIQAITADILKNGSIEVYIDDGSGWSKYPQSLKIQGHLLFPQQSLHIGTIRISIHTAELDLRKVSLRPLKHRIVIVPPSVRKRIIKEVDFSDYHAVVEYFQLKK